MTNPYISIVIPLHNEEEVLPLLESRLTAVMDNLKKTYEIILINDGSKDKTEQMLNEWHNRRPNEVRAIHFNGNFGQHMAIMAGMVLPDAADGVLLRHRQEGVGDPLQRGGARADAIQL